MTLRISFRHAYPDRAFNITIDTPTPGITVLFGPSGAGKSTVAAVAAGLLRTPEYYVAVDGTVLADSAAGCFLPTERRGIGMVFQDAKLFPHLSVAGNLRYGLRRAKEHRIGWDAVITLLGMSGLLARRPATLSGGERQRVAIGRALLSQPRLLIMDEPLASLDGPRRAEIIPYIARLSSGLALPILYITHALDEVARLADTLVVIEAGRVTAAGPVTEIAARAHLSIAADANAGAVLSCIVAGHLAERGLTRLALCDGPGLELVVPLQPLPAGQAVRVRIAAADVMIAVAVPPDISVQNIIPARIAALAPYLATFVAVELRLGQAPFLAHVTRDSAMRLALAVGLDVFVLIKSVSVHVLR